jgi:guanylate kinase
MKIFFLILSVLSFEIQAQQSKFLLLLGPSGAGKSTIIKHLKGMDDRFVYITPFTTRALRDGEQDKVHTSIEEIQRMEAAGELLTVNCIYGIYYATPKKMIDKALSEGKFPILDWPADKMALMQEQYNNSLFCVYVQPDNVEELQRRLALDERDKNGARLAAGIKEIENYFSGKYDEFVDLKIINNRGKDYEIAQHIYTKYKDSLK